MGTQGTMRLAIAGMGNMGSAHVQTAATLARIELVGICDVDQARVDRAGANTAARRYTDYVKMLDREKPDAVLIATPHYDHPAMSIEAFRRGMHVLVEKPVGVHALDVRRSIAAHEEARQKKPGIVFAAMFSLRTHAHWRKMKALIDEGELGRLVRTTWIITDWFRSQRYYDSGGWRATWKGEGGGVLTNQCPHNLDLFQWLVGMPDRITGFASLGKYHAIEVEDEVTAFLEYPGGCTGLFVTSTGEAPGTNRLEIAGDRGKLVYEEGDIQFIRNETPASEFLRTSKESFARPPASLVPVPVEGNGGQHAEVLENFADAIMTGAPLIAPAEEGIRSVELANAMLFSTLQGRPVDLPLDGAAFEVELKRLIVNSQFEKQTVEQTAADMTKSFS